MASTPRDEYETQVEGLSADIADPNIKTTEQDGELIRHWVEAYDPDIITNQPPERPKYADKRDPAFKTKSRRTLASYIERTRRISKVHPVSEVEPDDFNHWVQTNVSTDTWAKVTARNYQHAIRAMARYYELTGQPMANIPDHRDIAVYDQEEAVSDTPFDPTDILTHDDIEKLDDAATNTRDRAIFRTLLHTGMRSFALRTLRWRDIDLENGRYRFNTDTNGDGGLKHLYKADSWRSLGMAVGDLRDWKDDHQDSDNPDAYVFCQLSSWKQGADTEQIITRETIRYVLAQLKKRAKITKPLHPHMMRHNFVTICKRDYELPDDTVKRLIGHAPDSDVMETTYSHLADEDHNHRLDVAAGLKDETGDPHANKRFTPKACKVCKNPLSADTNFCGKCGVGVNVEAQNTEKETREVMWEEKAELNPETPEAKGLDVAREIMENDPEAKSAIMDEMKAEMKADIMADIRRELAGDAANADD